MWSRRGGHGYINHFYRIDEKHDELSRSRMAAQKAICAMTLHCTENLQSGVTCEVQTRAVNTAVCPANHLAVIAK